MEYAEFLALYRRIPYGPHGAWLQTGVIASHVANYAGKMLRDGVSVAPTDCMPDPFPPSEEEMKVRAKAAEDALFASFFPSS